MSRTPSRQRRALRIAAAYTVLAVLWITASDTVLGIVADARTVAQLGTVKGLVFVVLTGGLLYAALLTAPPASTTAAGPQDEPAPAPRALSPVPWIVLAAALALIGTVAWSCLQAYSAQVTTRLGRELGTLGALQADTVSRWITARRGDLEYASRFPSLQSHLGGSGEPDGQALDRLDAFRKHHGFDALQVLDRSLRAPGSAAATPLEPALQAAAQAALRQATPTLVGQTGGGEDQPARVSWVVPVLDATPGANRVLGVMVGQLAADAALARRLQHAPAGPPAVDTLLMLPGGQVMTAVTGRGAASSPLAVGAPPAGDNAAEPGLRPWKDARGLERLYVRQPVPGTPWTLVNSVARDEALQPIRQARLTVGVLTLVCIAAAGVFFLALRQRDRLVAELEAMARRQEVERARLRAAQAEAAVSASEDKFRSYMEHAPVGVMVLDSQGRVVEVNDCALGLLDCAAPPIGKRLLRAVHLTQPQAMLATWSRLRAHGHARTETAVTCRDGSQRWLWLTATRLGHDSYLGFFADITRMKQEELRLRRAEAVFNNTLEGLVITDIHAQVVAVNPAFSMLTGYSEQELVGRNMRVLSSGRQDEQFYAAMWRRLTTAGTWQGEMWNRRKSGEIYPLRLSINAVRDPQGRVVNYVGACTDITQAKESERALHHLAHHDALTGLPNRLMLSSLLDHAIQRARRAGTLGAVLMLDLDRFKTVNDSLGHPAGDELLQIVAARLRRSLREADTLARLGGDEFAVLLEDMHDPQDAAVVAGHLIESCAQPVVLGDGHEVYVGVSIGISLIPTDGDEGHELMQAADAALYGAKGNGRGVYHFYTDSLTRQAQQRLDTESRLRRALERNELELHYQPLVRVADRRIRGVEALVRWRDPQRGLVPPGEFIPLAEETGLIVPMGHWILREAARQMSAWLAEGLPVETMAVNLSAQHFAQVGLDGELAAILADTGLPARALELEITETALMDANRATEQLHRLKALGVTLAIDDFGTGYSSLAYLSRFPLDKLKVDRSFVKDLPHDATEVEIASAVIQLARALGLEVLAEGVENEEQLAFLRERGCDLAQGFLFARPLPADQLAELLAREPGEQAAPRSATV